MTTLLLSARHTPDNQLLWQAAVRRGWNVERLRGIRVPPLADEEIVIYVEALYGPTVAHALSRKLVEPDRDFLPRLPWEYRQRDIALSTFAAAQQLTEPRFLKPPNDKSFPARVYASGRELPEFPAPDDPVLIADPVTFEVEFRCFVREGKVVTWSPYLLRGELVTFDQAESLAREGERAKNFAQTVLNDPRVSVPQAVVLDVGPLSTGAWAVVEANAAWGSGIYHCDPNEVLETLRVAVTRVSWT